MTRQIWKYRFDVLAVFELELPKGAQVLCCQAHAGTPCMWAAVPYESKEKEKRKFKCVGTGHCIDDTDHKYIGTIQLYEGNLVFHLYEVVNV